MKQTTLHNNTPGLHIVSFDIPYPPNYGGAIDVYYKILALHKAGYAITLHCTYKGTLTRFPQLEQLCHSVHYYKRHTSVMAQLSYLPYGIVSRMNQELLNNLLQDEAPIIFEGLVSCYYLSHPALAKRIKVFRECNIEHDYYRGLAKASRSIWKKIFYLLEARKLQRFESVIRYATSIAAVAHQDEQYFQNHYPQVPVHYIPSFHGEQVIRAKNGKGDYILYHGNLQLAENENAALFILTQIAPAMPEIPFIFAGRQPSPKLKNQAAGLANVTIIDSPDAAQMEQLIADAHIHLLPTFQSTGLKLKLLNVLYNGRFVVVNPQMVHGTDVAPLCRIAGTPEEMITLCRELIKHSFSQEEIQKRQLILGKIYSDDANIQKLTHLLL